MKNNNYIMEGGFCFRGYGKGCKKNESPLRKAFREEQEKRKAAEEEKLNLPEIKQNKLVENNITNIEKNERTIKGFIKEFIETEEVFLKKLIECGGEMDYYTKSKSKEKDSDLTVKCGKLIQQIFIKHEVYNNSIKTINNNNNNNNKNTNINQKLEILFKAMETLFDDLLVFLYIEFNRQCNSTTNTTIKKKVYRMEKKCTSGKPPIMIESDENLFVDAHYIRIQLLMANLTKQIEKNKEILDVTNKKIFDETNIIKGNEVSNKVKKAVTFIEDILAEPINTKIKIPNVDLSDDERITVSFLNMENEYKHFKNKYTNYNPKLQSNITKLLSGLDTKHSRVGGSRKKSTKSTKPRKTTKRTKKSKKSTKRHTKRYTKRHTKRTKKN